MMFSLLSTLIILSKYSYLVKQTQSKLFSVLFRGQDGVDVGDNLSFEDGEGCHEHVVVRHVLPLQELLRLGGVSQTGTDPAIHDGRFTHYAVILLNVHCGQEASVNIGMSIAAPGHDLECFEESVRAGAQSSLSRSGPHPHPPHPHPP